MNDGYDEIGRRAEETAKAVFGEKQAAQIEAVFADGESLKRLYASMSEKDRKTVESVLQNPQLLKSILSSPKAREGLRKLLGGAKNG